MSGEVKGRDDVESTESVSVNVVAVDVENEVCRIDILPEVDLDERIKINEGKI